MTITNNSSKIHRSEDLKLTDSEKGQECVYVVYYTFCIIMMHCQDDKIECGLAEIIEATHIKRKKAVVSLFSATSRWSELGM